MRREPKHERIQSENQMNVAEEQKKKEKGKTRKKINFSQEILSSKRISKELKSRQQVPNYETPLLKRPRVICWEHEAYVGVRDKTPVNWGLEDCGADKHNEGGTFVMDTSAVEE
jgi:hypothetical protein